MARFFTDIMWQGGVIVDSEGQDFVSGEDAEAGAVLDLLDMAKRGLDIGMRVFEVAIRDEQGGVIRRTLTVSCVLGP